MTLWLAYITGLVIHWIAKSQAVVASPTSPVVSYAQWALRNWRAILVRSFLAAAGFGTWTAQPELSAMFSVTLNIYTAAAYGYLAESLLELASARIGILRGEIPRYNGK